MCQNFCLLVGFFGEKAHNLHTWKIQVYIYIDEPLLVVLNSQKKTIDSQGTKNTHKLRSAKGTKKPIWLVVSSHLKNMLFKFLDHFPKLRGIYVKKKHVITTNKNMLQQKHHLQVVPVMLDLCQKTTLTKTIHPGRI